jgi:hypothetical protein
MTEVTVKKYFDAILKHDPSLMMDLHRGISRVLPGVLHTSFARNSIFSAASIGILAAAIGTKV